MADLIPAPPALPRALLTAELGSDAVRSAVRSRKLVRARRGAYVEISDQVEPWKVKQDLALARCLAVAAELTCDYAISHASAALVHGCWVPSPDVVTHITQPVKPGPRAGDLVRHHGKLRDEDVTVVNGLRVTSLMRTVEDCARTMHPRAGLMVVDSALRMLARPDRRDREGSSRRIEETRAVLVDRIARASGYRGVSRARAVIAHADGFSESPGETALRWIAVSRGLPLPVSQMAVATERGVYFADLGWRVRDGRAGDEQRVVVAEFDGAVKYQSAGDQARNALFVEKQREDAMRDAGVTVQRFTAADLRDVDATFHRLCRVFPADVVVRRRPVAGLMVAAVGW